MILFILIYFILRLLFLIIHLQYTIDYNFENINSKSDVLNEKLQIFQIYFAQIII